LCTYTSTVSALTVTLALALSLLDDEIKVKKIDGLAVKEERINEDINTENRKERNNEDVRIVYLSWLFRYYRDLILQTVCCFDVS
jgi:hypothetical protein